MDITKEEFIKLHETKTVTGVNIDCGQQETVEQFLARGGKVSECSYGEQAMPFHRSMKSINNDNYRKAVELKNAKR